MKNVSKRDIKSPRPDFGDIGTISHVYIHGLSVILELKEFPQPGGMTLIGRTLPGWHTDDFRPVQSTGKGMEILRGLLNPKNHKNYKSKCTLLFLSFSDML